MNQIPDPVAQLAAADEFFYAQAAANERLQLDEQQPEDKAA